MWNIQEGAEVWAAAGSEEEEAAADTMEGIAMGAVLVEVVVTKYDNLDSAFPSIF